MEKSFILSPSFLGEPLPGLLNLAKPEWEINSTQIVSYDSQEQMMHIHTRLANFTEKSISQKKLPVSIAGDCCSAIAVLAGIQKANINPILIWFDAHGDFNTPQTSPSGFLGGMPLAMIAGKGFQQLPKNVGLKSLDEKQIILSDARDLDIGEKEILNNSNILHLKKISDFYKIELPNQPIHFHFDTDIITSEESPAQNFPVKNGPTFSEVQKVFNLIGKTCNIAAVSISSWNPDLDQDKKSEKLCMKLLNSFLENF